VLCLLVAFGATAGGVLNKGDNPMKNACGDNHEHYYMDELVPRKLNYLSAGPPKPRVPEPSKPEQPFPHPAVDTEEENR